MATRSLAIGTNEDQVRRRTGHKSDQLLKHRRAGRALAELDLGDVDPLVFAIAELRPIPAFEALLRKLSAETPTGNAPGGNDGGSKVGPEVGQKWSGRLDSNQRPSDPQATNDRDTTDATAENETPPADSDRTTERDGQPADRQVGPDLDVVEAALADALTRAAAAGQWSTVDALNRELQARRAARTAPGVVSLDARRARRKA